MVYRSKKASFPVRNGTVSKCHRWNEIENDKLLGRCAAASIKEWQKPIKDDPGLSESSFWSLLALFPQPL